MTSRVSARKAAPAPALSPGNLLGAFALLVALGGLAVRRRRRA